MVAKSPDMNWTGYTISHFICSIDNHQMSEIYLKRKKAYQNKIEWHGQCYWLLTIKKL